MVRVIGGAGGTRTRDLVNAIHALSQLSYGPFWCSGQESNLRPTACKAVALTG